jgi:hypothetical protein
MFVALLTATLLAACGGGGGDPQATTSEAVEVTPTSAETNPEPESEPEVPASDQSAITSTPRAVDCVPGVWQADMKSLMKVLQTEGNPKHRSGSYTITFSKDFSFVGKADESVFRISNADGFVDIHNSWTEDGMWGAATSEMTFEEVLLVMGSSLGAYADELTLIGGPELNDSMVLLEGIGYTPGEYFGMVNGKFRTPPLDDSGEALSAIGIVDCSAGTMQLGVNGAGWKGGFTLSKAS